jgi:hypothetical protein
MMQAVFSGRSQAWPGVPGSERAWTCIRCYKCLNDILATRIVLILLVAHVRQIRTFFTYRCALFRAPVGMTTMAGDSLAKKWALSAFSAAICAFLNPGFSPLARVDNVDVSRRFVTLSV